MKLLSSIAIILFFIFSFHAKHQKYNEYELTIPAGFPQPKIPKDNLLTTERIELGKLLFFDPIMSRDSSISCASCHQPELAFTDGLSKSIGIRDQVVSRNAPTLTNMAYQDSGLFLDGGVPTLEMQVVVPVQEHSEFDFDLKLIATRMKRDSTYMRLSYLAYNREPSAYVITRSIASFERTLISGNSRFDEFVNGDQGALSKFEKKGMKLFYNKLNCAKCHSGFNFTNMSLQNNGIYSYPYPLDSGRMRISHSEKDRDKFKVPTLRNIELTGPYMHDGSMNSLEEVIEHYDSGGYNHQNKSNLIQPLNLTKKEKLQLISFLKTLTDFQFIDPRNYQ